MTVMGISHLHRRLIQPVSIQPLILFRVLFGLLMLVSLIRFMARGWVQEFYIDPGFHFAFVSWLKPLPAFWMWGLFILMAGLTVCITLGLWYRLSMALFFLAFTYVELLDKTYYLNHYYFISLLSFLLFFLPLHRAYSVDSWRCPALKTAVVPAWTLLAIRLQLAVVYFFAGIAKLNSDWLFRAMPLQIWLAGNTGFPLIGPLFDYDWFAYLLSWTGVAFDLTIPFLLFWRKTRPWAYAAVVLFHLMTAQLFLIGMFPWIMIACTLIFFDWGRLDAPIMTLPTPVWPKRTGGILALFFFIQCLLPWRHWLYPGNVLWHEAGFRFSWRVMLVEKTGDATFYVTTADQRYTWVIHPADYLTPQQEKQMAFQPDMILQFAHYLEQQFQAYGDVSVQAEVYVSLNGRASRLLIDPTADLTRYQDRWWAAKPWIRPLQPAKIAAAAKAKRGSWVSLFFYVHFKPSLEHRYS